MKEVGRVATVGLFSRVGRFTSMVWVAALVVSWLSASPASANSAPLPVSFADSGRGLPQAQIRVAIATELGRETLAEVVGGDGELENRERVLVAVDELGQLWVRYWGPRGLVDRHLPMPEQPEQIPVVVSLSVGNLAREEAFELLRDLEQRRAEERRRAQQAKAAPASSKPGAKPAAPAPKRALAPRPALPRRAPAQKSRAGPRNSWGHHVVADLPWLPGAERNCLPGSRDACYDWAYLPIAYDIEGSGRDGGLVAAHGRYVMTYSRALVPDVWGSLRVGFAFLGADAQNEAAKRDSSVSSFMPWLVEARAQYFPFRRVFAGTSRPFAHVTAGFAEETPQLDVQPPMETQTDARGGTPIRVTYAMGPFFAGGGLGCSVAVFGPVRLEAELSWFGAFPKSGWFVRPSVGGSYDF